MREPLLLTYSKGNGGIDCNGQERTELGKHYQKSDGGGGVSQYEWKKLCRPFQAVKNISFHPSFKPSVTESKIAHQLLLNGKLVTNM